MAKNVSEGRFGVQFSKIFWGRTPTPPPPNLNIILPMHQVTRFVFYEIGGGGVSYYFGYLVPDIRPPGTGLMRL